MRRRLIVFSAGLVAALALTGPAVADHGTICPPSAETGLAVETGREFAQEHIVPLAHLGVIGRTHKPGSHQGFSNCVHEDAPGQQD